MRLLSSKIVSLQRLSRENARRTVLVLRSYHTHKACSTSSLVRWRNQSRFTTHHRQQLVGIRPLSSVATTTDNDDDDSPKKTIPFLLADIGEGIAEVELLQWFVAPGDTVSQFDRVCEVQSDKATVEITSRYDGIVESLNGKVGDMIQVGSPLLYIAVQNTGDDANGDANQAVVAAPTLNNVDDEQDKLSIPSVASVFSIQGDEQTTGERTQRAQKPKVLTTPAVRKIGMDYNLDLSTIMGTGPGGRVLKADVLQILKDRGLYKEETDKHTAVETQQESSTTEPHVVAAAMPQVPSGTDTVVPIRGYNRLMVKSMTASLQVPQMVYSDEINMNLMRKCREELKPLAEAHGIAKLSFLPFLVKAASMAMVQYPVLNSSLNADDFTLTYHGNHNIGVAMDTPRGLAVPVVKSCQDLSILDIAKELARLQQAGSEGNLSESDITGATFTLSNIGAIGGTYMSPIVTPPQVAIGAMGKIQRLPRYVGDKVEEVHVMQISWGGDHRVVDGASMARFSNQWKDYIENPASMIFSLR